MIYAYFLFIALKYEVYWSRAPFKCWFHGDIHIVLLLLYIITTCPAGLTPRLTSLTPADDKPFRLRLTAQ